MNMESLFFKYQESLKNVFEAFQNTDFGRKYETTLSGIDTYADFCQLPLVDSSVLSLYPERLALNVDTCTKFTTSGTLGKQKTLFIPVPIKAAPLPEKLDRLAHNTKTAFIYTAIDFQADTFMTGHYNTYSQLYPKASFRKFGSIESVANIVNSFETVSLFDYPSAFPRFLNLVEQALALGSLDQGDITVKKIHAKLTGESMDAEVVKKWMQTCFELFGFWPIMDLRYGASEVQDIGGCDFKSKTSKIEYELSEKHCFLELLDPVDYKPITGQEGIVVVTSFRTSGTILVRYILGDTAVANFVDDKMIITNIGRRDTFSIAGIPVSMEHMSRQIIQRFGAGCRLVVNRYVSASTGKQTIDVVVELANNSSMAENEVQDYVRAFLTNTVPISENLIRDKSIALNIVVSTLSLDEWSHNKAWKLNEQTVV